jgi:hypothetical protein
MGRMVFNFITLIFTVLTVLAGVIVLAVMAGSMDSPLWPANKTAVPTSTLASDLLTLTPPATLPPATPIASPVLMTYTPVPKTPTPTASNTPTGIPSPTDTATSTATNTPQPSSTKAPPTETPTMTLTFTASPTETFTPSPTGPTPTPTNTESPFPFIVQPGSLVVRDNYLNGASCNWQGFAGQIVTSTGEAVQGITVRVSSEGLADLFSISGTSQIYGPSGWEIPVDSKPNSNRYKVELVSGGVPISPSVEVVFPNSCQQNLAQVNFVQTRPF